MFSLRRAHQQDAISNRYRKNQSNFDFSKAKDYSPINIIDFQIKDEILCQAQNLIFFLTYKIYLIFLNIIIIFIKIKLFVIEEKKMKKFQTRQKANFLFYF